MFGKKLIFLLTKEGKGAVIEFPEAFEYPKNKTVPQKEENVEYERTDRTRMVGDREARIYTQRGCRLNLDDFATGWAEEEQRPGVAPAPEPAVSNIETSDGDEAPLTITIGYNPATSGYEAVTSVGTTFNRNLVEAMGKNGREVLEDLMAGIAIDLRRKAKKKDNGVIKDVIAIDFE